MKKLSQHDQMSSCKSCFRVFKNALTLEKNNGLCARCFRNLTTPDYSKAPIPKSLRDEVWLRDIGNKFFGNCFVCNVSIKYSEYSCGHIVSEKLGGKMIKENMKVLCKSCNSKMGTENLFDYKARKFPKRCNCCAIL
jgi:hypothetical protein